MRAKEVKVATVRLKKRALEEDKVDQLSKRARTNASRKRNAANSHTSSSKSDCAIVQHSDATHSEGNGALNIVHEGNTLGVSILQSGRFGRTVRLPTRFR